MGAMTGKGARREHEQLRRVSAVLRELEETLLAGIVPEARRWERLRSLADPWGKLAYESVSELRSRGGSLVPTLKRLRELSDAHLESWLEAKARASQALAQAAICAALTPLFGGALYLLLPGVSDHPVRWICICLWAVLFSGAGAFWMLRIAESARWGGMRRSERSWILLVQCAGERILALIRTGSPPDLAWARALETLSQDAPELASRWGISIWETESEPLSSGSGPRDSIFKLGSSVRRAVQLSLMEGRSCVERLESVFHTFRHEMKAHRERELGVVSTKALKPLFVFVAPGLFFLLAAGLWMSWSGGFV